MQCKSYPGPWISSLLSMSEQTTSIPSETQYPELICAEMNMYLLGTVAGGESNINNNN